MIAVDYLHRTRSTVMVWASRLPASYPNRRTPHVSATGGSGEGFPSHGL